jgi:hypothetical protein
VSGKLPNKKTEMTKGKSRIKGEVGRVSRTAALLIAVGVLGALSAGYFAYQNDMIPGIHQPTDTPDTPTTLTTISPDAKEYTVDATNSVQMTLADYEKIAPPLWANKSMVVPLFIEFANNRIPTLRIEKAPDPYADGTLDIINIGGLEEGDTFIAPFDCDIELFWGGEDLREFFLITKDSKGEEITLVIKTTGLNPLFEFKSPITTDTDRKTIKKGDRIGSLLTPKKHYAFNGQIQISGSAPLLENFNLATTPEGKLIEIIK